MPRIARIKPSGEPVVYHVMSRTALPGYPLNPVEKDFFVNLVRKLSKIYFVEILGYSIMGNHFHLLINMLPFDEFPDEEIVTRYKLRYGEEKTISEGQVPFFREKWSDVSVFMKEVKSAFSRHYNKKHKRWGFFWGERFKSVIVEKGTTLINCLAYIDLNAVRAGIVDKPEEYRWCSLNYHVQTNNSGGFLSYNFGLEEFNVKGYDIKLKRYRKFVYEKWASSEVAGTRIDDKVLEKEKEKDFEVNKINRFKYKTRYFTDSGIIGSKEFVSKKYQQFKHVFLTKKEKIPKPVSGLDGMYSLKRLSEQN